MEEINTNQEVKKDTLIIGSWLKNLRLLEDNKDMVSSVIEEYLNLDEGELNRIEEGVEIPDYITMNKLIGIYCNDKETATFPYIMKNINNQLPIAENAPIINQILNKDDLVIEKETREDNVYKTIKTGGKAEYIEISKQNKNSIRVVIQLDGLYHQVTIDIDREKYIYNSLLDNVFVIYRTLYYESVRPSIIEKSKTIHNFDFVDKLFNEI